MSENISFYNAVTHSECHFDNIIIIIINIKYLIIEEPDNTQK